MHAAVLFTWQWILEASRTQASTDFAPDRQQVKCEHIWATRCGPQLLVPPNKARRLRISKHQVLVDACVHLHAQHDIFALLKNGIQINPDRME